MKTLIIVLFSFTQLLFAQEKTSIAVLSLQGNGISPSEAVVLTDELRTVLVQAGKYNVLEHGVYFAGTGVSNERLYLC